MYFVGFFAISEYILLAPILVTILSKDSDFRIIPWCYNQVLSSYKNLLCNATFFSIFPQLPHGTMKSLKVPHPIYTKTSPLIGINVSEKKLSLPELDS